MFLVGCLFLCKANSRSDVLAVSGPYANIDRLSPSQRPSGRAIGYQRWSDLSFLHWRVSAAAIANLLPDGLSVDTFDGSAWVGLVPFRMSGVRPWWSPSIPGISAFPETNVRTYVHCRGRDPGVWFLSLDAGSSLGAYLGRHKWGLPYYRSKMSVRRNGARISYSCLRRWPAPAGIGGAIEAEIGQPLTNTIARVSLESLEYFLVERYVLYSVIRDRVYQGRVHHSPYPLTRAKLLSSNQTFLRPVGLEMKRPPDHVLFSPGVSTEIFPLRPLGAMS